MTDNQQQPVPPTPPAAYGQPGCGGPAPWPPPIPDRRGGKGKAIGITIGAVAVVGALIAGAVYFVGSSDNDTAAYRIELPETLLGGEYKKDKDDADSAKSEDISAKDRAQMKSFGIEDADGDAAGYQSDKRGSLEVVGMYGRIPDPEKTLDRMAAGQEKAGAGNGKPPLGGKTERGTYKDYRPRGFDGIALKCKADTTSFSFGDKNTSMTLSQCLWADKGTIASVTSMPFGGEGDAKGISAEELAEITARIRQEVRKPK
ncbi:hypothetical protein [Streptomyces sp. XH2]|uniref:hypothetical protein n=1 Tax=Streptomyces sp. XH2 TaxID=3412483 RepID=UPI003C7CA1C7